MRGLRRLDNKFVDILFNLFEVEADDPEIAGVVKLEEVEAERFPIESLRRPDGEGFANKSIVNFAGVLQTDPVAARSRAATDRINVPWNACSGQ